MKAGYFREFSIGCLLLPIVLIVFCHCVQAQNSAFSFQGKLNENGAAANGLYDLEFKLYEAPAGGQAAAGNTRAAALTQ